MTGPNRVLVVGSGLTLENGVVCDSRCRAADGDLASRRFVARWISGGVVTGVLGWNMPKQTRLHRAEIEFAVPVH